MSTPKSIRSAKDFFEAIVEKPEPKREVYRAPSDTPIAVSSLEEVRGRDALARYWNSIDPSVDRSGPLSLNPDGALALETYHRAIEGTPEDAARRAEDEAELRVVDRAAFAHGGEEKANG